MAMRRETRPDAYFEPALYLEHKLGIQSGAATNVLNELVDLGYLSMHKLKKVVKKMRRGRKMLGL